MNIDGKTQLDFKEKKFYKLECVAYFCLWQHFHDDWEKEENNCSVEVESAKEKNCLFQNWENFERDND